MVLMEAAPSHIDQAKLAAAIKECGDEIKIGEFHLWEISKGKVALSCNISCAGEPMKVLKKATEVCKGKPFKIQTVTLQVYDTTVAEEDQMDLVLSPQAYSHEADPNAEVSEFKGEGEHDHGHGHHHH